MTQAEIAEAKNFLSSAQGLCCGWHRLIELATLQGISPMALREANVQLFQEALEARGEVVAR